MGFLNKSIIGLEVDSQEIRAVELKGSQKKFSLLAWGRVNLPEGVVKEGRVINPDTFSVYLEKLLSENRFKGRDVILGVNNQDVIVRFASFPKVPEDKLRGMIRFQAQEYIPISIEELELDYVVVGERKTEDSDMLNVILVGAKKKMLNDFIDACTKAKLSIKEIDSTMFALGRAALLESQDGTFSLSAFNNDIGNILIFKDGLLGIARSVSITQAPAWVSFRVTSGNKEMEANLIADILFGEIRSSIGYYKMQNNDNIEKLYVIGCGASQEQVAQRLRETTGLSVSVPEAYKALESHASKGLGAFKASDYVASISLAIRGLGE